MKAGFEQLLSWCRKHYRYTHRSLEQLCDLKGCRLAFQVHLDLKMVPFFEGLHGKQAELLITSCNPKTVDHQAMSHLARQGLTIDLEPGHQQRALEWKPDFLVEFGGGLTQAALEGSWDGVRGSLEGTGSGVRRSAEVTLPYPILNWDSLPLKRAIHNRKMVGLCAWHTFFAVTYLTLHDKTVLVIGYGPVGQGVAEAARHFGARVVVAERDSERATQARFEGWRVESLESALPLAEVVVTATGAKNVVGARHWPLLKGDSILFNVGHEDGELEFDSLELELSEALPGCHQMSDGQKSVYLLAGGSMLNLSAGFGDSINSFDLTLSLMAQQLGRLVRGAHLNPPGLYSPESWSDGPATS